MQVSENTPRDSGFGVGGVDDLTIVTPISEGHTCSAEEAHALNQLLKENARNNLREKVKAAVAVGADKAAVQKILDEYVEGYSFGAGGGGGGRTSDPIMAEALDKARKLIRKALVKKGIKVSSVSAADINARAKKLVERRPDIYKAAKKEVADRDKMMDGVLEETEE